MTPLRAIIIAALAVCAIEAALNFAPEGYMVKTLRGRVREIVTQDASPVQIMGDSVSAAVSGWAVARECQRPSDFVSNYSLPGTSPLFAYYTLRRELDSGRAPRVIVYAPHPANLGAPMSERFLGRFATPREAWEFGRKARIGDTAFGLLCRLSYTLRYRAELYGVVTQGDLEFFRSMRNPVVSLKAYQQPLEPPPEPVEGPIFREKDLPPALFAGFAVDEYNAFSLDRFFQLAEERKIPILWVSLPCIPAFVDRWRRGGDMASYEKYLHDLSQKHANVILLHKEIDAWPDRYFEDVRHLNRAGAWKLSAQIGREMRTWIDAGSNDATRLKLSAE